MKPNKTKSLIVRNYPNPEKRLFIHTFNRYGYIDYSTLTGDDPNSVNVILTFKKANVAYKAWKDRNGTILKGSKLIIDFYFPDDQHSGGSGTPLDIKTQQNSEKKPSITDRIIKNSDQKGQQPQKSLTIQTKTGEEITVKKKDSMTKSSEVESGEVSNSEPVLQQPKNGGSEEGKSSKQDDQKPKEGESYMEPEENRGSGPLSATNEVKLEPGQLVQVATPTSTKDSVSANNNNNKFSTKSYGQQQQQQQQPKNNGGGAPIEIDINKEAQMNTHSGLSNPSLQGNSGYNNMKQQSYSLESIQRTPSSYEKLASLPSYDYDSYILSNSQQGTIGLQKSESQIKDENPLQKGGGYNTTNGPPHSSNKSREYGSLPSGGADTSGHPYSSYDPKSAYLEKDSRQNSSSRYHHHPDDSYSRHRDRGSRSKSRSGSHGRRHHYHYRRSDSSSRRHSKRSDSASRRRRQGGSSSYHDDYYYKDRKGGYDDHRERDRYYDEEMYRRKDHHHRRKSSYSNERKYGGRSSHSYERKRSSYSRERYGGGGQPHSGRYSSKAPGGSDYKRSSRSRSPHSEYRHHSSRPPRQSDQIGSKSQRNMGPSTPQQQQIQPEEVAQKVGNQLTKSNSIEETKSIVVQKSPPQENISQPDNKKDTIVSESTVPKPDPVQSQEPQKQQQQSQQEEKQAPAAESIKYEGQLPSFTSEQSKPQEQEKIVEEKSMEAEPQEQIITGMKDFKENWEKLPDYLQNSLFQYICMGGDQKKLLQQVKKRK